MSLVEALSPSRVQTSPKFTAVLAFILDEHWTDPRIIGLTVLSDGLVMIAHDDDPFDNHMLGYEDELFVNLDGIAQAAGLSSDDTEALHAAARSHLTHV